MLAIENEQFCIRQVILLESIRIHRHKALSIHRFCQSIVLNSRSQCSPSIKLRRRRYNRHSNELRFMSAEP